MISLFEQFMSHVEKNCRSKKRVEEIRRRMKDEPCFDEPPEDDEGGYEFLKQYDDGLAIVRQMKKEKNWQTLSDVTYTGMDIEQRILALQVYYEDKNPFPKKDRIKKDNLQGAYGRTRLHVAVLEEDLKCISELITSGANCKIKDNNGYTPYLLGVLEGKTKAIKLLKKLGIRE